MAPPTEARRVWLIGGPSSVGKTTACARLAEQLGASLLSIDKTFSGLTYPPRFHELLAAGDVPGLLESLRQKEEKLRNVLDQKVKELREAPGLTIIEGEGWATGALANNLRHAEVSGAVVTECEPERMTSTLAQASKSFARLPVEQQETLVTVNVLYGARLTEEAQRLSIPVVQSFPMVTLQERLGEALGIG